MTTALKRESDTACVEECATHAGGRPRLILADDVQAFKEGEALRRAFRMPRIRNKRKVKGKRKPRKGTFPLVIEKVPEPNEILRRVWCTLEAKKSKA